MRYGCIEVDPPWKSRNPGGMHGANGGNSITPTYPRMSLDELLHWKLPVEPAEQCHLWLWATAEHVVFADRVIEAWGFRPVGSMRVWHKKQPGPGMWFQNDAEFVRLGVLGRQFRRPPAEVKAMLGYFPRAVFVASREGPHSTKPDIFYRETLAISPGPYISLFQRFKREGWEGWGNEYDQNTTEANNAGSRVD